MLANQLRRVRTIWKWRHLKQSNVKFKEEKWTRRDRERERESTLFSYRHSHSHLVLSQWAQMTIRQRETVTLSIYALFFYDDFFWRNQSTLSTILTGFYLFLCLMGEHRWRVPLTICIDPSKNKMKFWHPYGFTCEKYKIGIECGVQHRWGTVFYCSLRYCCCSCCFN